MNKRYTFTVQERPLGRCDLYLMEHLPKTFSRSQLRRLFKEGKVWVNGELTKPHRRLSKGETVEVEWTVRPEPAVAPENIPLKIVYEDSHLIVIDKAPGMVVHPAAGNWSGTLVNALLYHAKELSSVNGPFRPGIVHRLDKETSGLLVCAKNDVVHRALARQFEERTIKRNYLALVMGVVRFDEGVIDLPLGRSRSNRKKFAVQPIEGKKAVTRYEVIQRFKEFTFLKLKLDTGRTHQIRVHLAHLGYPIIGDRTYGAAQGLLRQALHAQTLGFIHPVTEAFQQFESPLPDDMKRLIEKGSLR